MSGHLNQLRLTRAEGRAIVYLSLFFLLLLCAEVVAILRLNSGKFVYTLDDPYIHLALAENIWRGHYGVNLNELSAPSSSIIWPYLLAPLAAIESWPLILNAMFGIGTCWLFVRILALAVRPANGDSVLFYTGVGSALLLSTNLIGLSLMGMEHVLQVLIVVMVAYGLAVDVRQNRLPPWLIVAAICAPAVRYENLAVTAACVAYLLMTGRRRLAFCTILGAGLMVVAFSALLTWMGLGLFPSSVSVKSDLVGSGNKFMALAKNVHLSFNSRPGVLLVLIASGVLLFMPPVSDKKRRAIAASLLVCLGLHLLSGRYGWYNRYEVYVLAFAITTLISLFVPKWEALSCFTVWKRVSMFAFPLLIIGFPYLVGLATAPFAANSIFEQHYQMHRLVTEHLKEPVAVNDLGYVAYKNDLYVLDLYGLGSEKARRLRSSKPDSAWMDELCREHNVRVALIYTSWFKHLPEGWYKLAELKLSRPKIILDHSVVDVYATRAEAVDELDTKLRAFVSQLPPGVELTLNDRPLP